VEQHLTFEAASIGMAGSFSYPGTDHVPTSVSSSVGAFDVIYYVGNTNDATGFNYLIDPSPSADTTYVNYSTSGMSTGLGNLVDWASRNDLTFTTLAVGNSPTSINQCKNSWNALCVGAYGYEDATTVSDDRAMSYTEYLNNTTAPSPIGLERPHLLGPAAFSTTLTGVGDGLFMPDVQSSSNAMIGFGQDLLGGNIDNMITGTSYAAPALLGLGIQVHQYEGWFSYMAYPVAKKAVLMASAVDSNADGAVKDTTTWSGGSDGIDGAGHPNRTFMKQILDNNQYVYVSLSDASFVSCGTGCREYVAATVTAPSNKAIKVALAWNACTLDRNNTSTLINNNFDLAVKKPALCFGATVQSASANSEVEMVYDTCLVGYGGTGTYTIKVRISGGGTLNGCAGATSEPVAVAWSYQ
jgi:hypothetical protein